MKFKTTPITVGGRHFKRVFRGYKFVHEGGKAPFTGFDYSSWLPSRGKTGSWLPCYKKRELSMCIRGYHLLDNLKDLKTWRRCFPYNFNSSRGLMVVYLCEAVGRGEAQADLYDDPKVLYQSFRFVRKIKVIAA